MALRRLPDDSGGPAPFSGFPILPAGRGTGRQEALLSCLRPRLTVAPGPSGRSAPGGQEPPRSWRRQAGTPNHGDRSPPVGPTPVPPRGDVTNLTGPTWWRFRRRTRRRTCSQRAERREGSAMRPSHRPSRRPSPRRAIDDLAAVPCHPLDARPGRHNARHQSTADEHMPDGRHPPNAGGEPAWIEHVTSCPAVRTRAWLASGMSDCPWR